MTGAMNAAIAGLRTHMQNLSVIGNNVANVNTQAYKAGRGVFETSLYTSLNGGSNGTDTVGGKNPSQLGYGVSLGSVDIDMSTGNYGVTGKPTDCMLDGEGFFMVGDKTLAGNFDGTADDVNRLTSFTLTRVGSFEFKADGYLTNNQGDVVYGFLCIGYDQTTQKPIFSDQLVPIRYPRLSVTTNAAGGTSTQIAYPTVGDGQGQGGRLQDARPENATDATAELPMALFEGIKIDQKTGVITGTSKDTGEVVTIGAIAVASVTNPNGVTQLSGTYYKAGDGSGQMTVAMLGGAAEEVGISYINQSLAGNAAGGTDTPPDGLRIRTSRTEMLSNGLEMSKTDLAQEIANMIVTQRGYQANTRIITVTDSMLEELVNMKR